MAQVPSSGPPVTPRGARGARRWHGVAAALAGLLGAAGAVGVGCRAPDARAPRPAPVLASGRAAQAELRDLELAWRDASPSGRAALEPRLRSFLSRHPADDGCRLARVYLAFIVAAAGDAAGSEALVAPVRRGPTGAVRDLADVAAARVLLARGRARDALAILEPLAGRLIGPVERTLHAEATALAATESGEFALAIRAMEAWLVDVPAPQREEALAAVARLLGRCPRPLLERTAASLDARAAATPGEPAAAARDALRRAVRERLMQSAIDERDAELAQRLVARSPAALLKDERGEALVALAATGVVAPRVVGRTVGVILSLQTADSRRRSAAVVAGVSRALRSSSGAPAPVRLTTRDDGGDPEAMSAALAALAGEGAGVLVAGVDPDGATRALAYAAVAGVPLLVLSPPEAPPPADGFAFVVGVDATAARGALETALAAAAPGVMPVVVGPGGLACDAGADVGRRRFPAADWRRTASPLLLTGPSDCVRDALAAAAAAGHRAAVAVDLEGAEGLAGLARRAPTLVARAGRFPSVPVTDRTLSLYQVLGHDAAVLAAAALAEVAEGRVEGAEEVASTHRAIRDRLASVEVELWSATATGFSGGRSLARTIDVVALSPAAKGVAP